MTYDSRAATLAHSQRVGELMADTIKELVDRSMRHDRSKTESPELEVFDEFTPKLKGTTYGSDEYKSYLASMRAGLDHHYAHNRHHPEHFPNGVDGMTLVDLIEMLADWKASTERHDDGNLIRSLEIQKERFGLSDQVVQILFNTAEHFVWVRGKACGAQDIYKGMDMVCNVPLDGIGWHWGAHADGRFDPTVQEWFVVMCDTCNEYLVDSGTDAFCTEEDANRRARNNHWRIGRGGGHYCGCEERKSTKAGQR